MFYFWRSPALTRGLDTWRAKAVTTKNRGACALTRAGGSLYTIDFKSDGGEPNLSISGLDPVPLSKIETHLLASLGSKGKMRNSLACLRNSEFHSAESYCSALITDQADAFIGPALPAH